jgi:hypothetical protein
VIFDEPLGDPGQRTSSTGVRSGPTQTGVPVTSEARIAVAAQSNTFPEIGNGSLCDLSRGHRVERCTRRVAVKRPRATGPPSVLHSTATSSLWCGDKPRETAAPARAASASKRVHSGRCRPATKRRLNDETRRLRRVPKEPSAGLEPATPSLPSTRAVLRPVAGFAKSAASRSFRRARPEPLLPGVAVQRFLAASMVLGSTGVHGDSAALRSLS